MKLINQVLTGTVLLFAVYSANATLITNGFTYAVASSDDQAAGNHFHSSTGGDFGNPSGLAEVGAYSTEEIRGLSEYDLSGQANSTSAFVTFDVFSTGLFGGVNDFSFDGDISIIAYQGNNSEDLNDYEATATAIVGSFSTVGIAVGDIFSFDILNIFNNAIDNGWSSLGIRLQTEDNTIDGGAWTFSDFRLTTTDESTGVPVPTPASIALFCIGLVGLRLTRK